MTPLRQRMLEDMQVRNLSPLTQRAYIEHVSRFARHFGRSPARLGPEEIRAYQVYLTNDKQLAPASIVITVAALRFLYTVTLQKPWSVAAVIPAPKAPQTLPVVLSPAEVVHLQDAIAVGSVHKTNPHTYGVSYFSSRGPTADGRLKPDVVAPGDRILSCRHRLPRAVRSIEDEYVEMSGPSMAAPHVSGALAAFLSVRSEFIGEADRVKEHLLRNSTDLGRDRFQQGAGLPNIVKMLVNT